MKWLWWLLTVFVLATAVRETIDYFGPMARAYRSYREEARASGRATKADARFRDIEGHITDVTYSLESAERLADGGVRLVVLEAVHFQRFSESGPFGNRRVAQTRQHVVMNRLDGRWVVSELQEEATEVTDVGALVAED